MDIRNEIDFLTQEFNNYFTAEVEKCLSKQKEFYQMPQSFDEELKMCILSYSKGGKRIRPFIVNYVSGIKLNNTDILNACLALELFHLSALIHDDIIDEANLRRGEKTIHYFVNEYSKIKKSLGQDIAILMGDLFLTRAFYFASQLPILAKDAFFEMVERTIRGQYIDVLGANEEFGKIENDLVIARHKLKTAWYTFGSPAYIGILLSGSSYNEKDTNLIIDAAIQIGLLFQIRDDILDCIDEKSGKRLYGDIYENQTTWVTLYLKQNYINEYNLLKENIFNLNDEFLKSLFDNVDFSTPYNDEMNKVKNTIDNLPQEINEIKLKLQNLLSLLKLK